MNIHAENEEQNFDVQRYKTGKLKKKGNFVKVGLIVVSFIFCPQMSNFISQLKI